MNATEEASPPVPIATYDPLAEYVRWCLAQPFAIPRCPAMGMTRVGAFSGLILNRSGQFQAQLWIADPNSEIPDHRHPDVEQIQVYLAGDIYLRKNGEVKTTPEMLRQLPDGCSNANGAMWRIKPEDTHGATIGPMGGAFINFQMWLRGTPESVHLNWIGEPLDTEHAIALGAK